jgi:hypothetical protein
VAQPKAGVEHGFDTSGAHRRTGPAQDELDIITDIKICMR